MGVAIQVMVELTEIHCGECGGTYAINERYRALQYQKGGSWHCPYCQVGWGYANNNENAKLKRELENERRYKANALARANEEAAARLKAERALKRHKTRTKNGACPCCNRTFVQLARHIKTKHPEYEA